MIYKIECTIYCIGHSKSCKSKNLKTNQLTSTGYIKHIAPGLMEHQKREEYMSVKRNWRNYLLDVFLLYVFRG